MPYNVGEKVRIKINDEVYQKYWGAFGIVNKVINDYVVDVCLESGDVITFYSEKLTHVNSKPLEPRDINPDKSVIPHDLWLVLRKKEIQNAIISFAEAGLPIKQEWVDEWNGKKNE